MTALPTVRRIHDEASLAALAPAWADLFARVPGAPVFTHPAWLIAWWRAFAPGRLATLAVFRGPRLVALAPLYREAAPAGDRLLPVGISVSDHLDVLVDPTDARAAGSALADALGDGSAARLDLEDLAPGAAALALPLPAGWRDHVEPIVAAPALDLSAALSGGVDDDGLPLAVPAVWRRKVRRARRIAGEAGGLVIEDGAADPHAFLAILTDLHTATWRARGGPGVLADPRVLAFHRAALPALVAAGLARLRLARIGGRPAGAYYGFSAGGTASAYLGGYAADFAAASPGMLLIADAIISAVREGAHTFDFLRGREDYKYRWGATDRWNARRSLLPPESPQTPQTPELP